MANIAGGYQQAGAIQGAKDYQAMQAQDIANRGNQLYLDQKVDADKAYRIIMDQWQKQRRAGAPGAQPQQAIPQQQAAAGQQPVVQGAQQPAQALTPIESPDGQQWAAAPSGQALHVAQPQAVGQVQAPQAQVPAAGAQAAPAPAMAQAQALPPEQQGVWDKLLSKFGNIFGGDKTQMQAAATQLGIPMSVGGMKGAMAAQQHIEQFEKEGALQDINRMFRALSGRSEATQREGAAEYLQAHGVQGAPTSFSQKVEKDGKSGWYAQHRDAKTGQLVEDQFIPDLGGGFLDSYTRILYGAVDRYGTIGAGIEQGNKTALEMVKGDQKVREQAAKGQAIGKIQEQKDKAHMERSKVDAESRTKAAGIRAGATVKAAELRAGNMQAIDKESESLRKQMKDVQDRYKPDALGRRPPLSPEDQKTSDRIQKRLDFLNRQRAMLNPGGGEDEESTPGAGSGAAPSASDDWRNFK